MLKLECNEKPAIVDRVELCLQLRAYCFMEKVIFCGKLLIIIDRDYIKTLTL